MKTKKTKKTITCKRCGKPTLLTRPNKRFCSERCRKNEEKKRYRLRCKEKQGNSK